VEKCKSGLHQAGRHILVPRGALRVGMACALFGEDFDTLTAARKACRSGQAVVRCSDGKVVSVK